MRERGRQGTVGLGDFHGQERQNRGEAGAGSYEGPRIPLCATREGKAAVSVSRGVGRGLFSAIAGLV